MRFGILGPLQVRGTAGPAAVQGTKRRALLVALLARANDAVSVDELVEWLWPHRPPVTAATAIQANVSVLRRTLEPDRPPWSPPRILLTQPPGYLVRVTTEQLDVLLFEDLVRRGTGALQRGDAAVASTLLREALGLWRGGALSDVRYVEAAQSEIARLEELRLGGLALRIDADLRQGRFQDVVPELSRLVIDHPLHERFHGQLMVALNGCGRRADALAVFHRVRRTLADELHVEPGRDLRDLEALILAGSDGLTGESSGEARNTHR